MKEGGIYLNKKRAEIKLQHLLIIACHNYKKCTQEFQNKQV